MPLRGSALFAACVIALAPAIVVRAQALRDTPPAAAPAPQPPSKDSLGRDTPRGTVIGFLSAARKGENELARGYLDTGTTGNPGDDLAHQLFVVLDARLPARLTQLSDAPEGSRSSPLTPNQDLVGTINSGNGNVDIVVERVDRGPEGTVWLFSRSTLEAIPPVYEEIIQSRNGTGFPRLPAITRSDRARAAEWFLFLVGISGLYLLTVLVNRILTPPFGRAWNRILRNPETSTHNFMAFPARVLLVTLASRWLLSNLSLSLFVRQFWSNATSVVTILAVIWLLILLNGEIEHHVGRRLPRANVAAASSLLRLLRRAGDALVIFVGILATLRLFAIDPTPALAGLGVGGIAVALAAQKTLENVIAGASLIFDQAVRVGDFLKMGEIVGTVDHIGLRSTRIRTLDRTIVSIPNSQIASASLETISARDKFWFHPVIGLRYETTPGQLQAVLDGIRGLLEKHPSIEATSVRVRLLRLGAFSLDVEAYAYFYARDWSHFLEIQERLLRDATEIVNRAGTGIAFPSQTMYVAGATSSLPGAVESVGPR
jgi:MscS family membrane protein